MQPGDRKYCIACGERLDDSASEYIDSRLYFERRGWMNVAALAALLLTGGNIALMCVFGNTHDVVVPFLCAVVFALTLFVFAFPEYAYKTFGFIGAYLGSGRYRRLNFAESLPDDIDDPYPENVRRMFIVFAILSAVALLASVWYFVNISSFALTPDPVFSKGQPYSLNV